MDKRIFGIPPILREGESISTHCLQACQGIAMREEIERLRESLKIFADNVKETNAGIDKNWAETVYALKAENQRLRKANKRLGEIATDAVEWLPPASVNGPREKYQNEIKELTDGHC